MKKLHNKDFSIAVKTGTEANKSKFAKEAFKGEAYFATDSENLYFAQSTAGASDSILMKIEPSALAFQNNYSLAFDGSNDYANVTLGTQIFSGDFTLSFWCKPDTSSAPFTTLMQLGGYSGGFRLYRYPPAGTFAWWKGDFGSGYNNIFGDFGSSSANTWLNMTIVRSGTAMTAYLNGSQVATEDNSDSAHSYTHTNWDINSTTYPFEGLMDEIALWGRALSASDAMAIYNNSKNILALSPINWWRMEDGAGATITDQGSGGNDATLVNGPTFSTDTP